MINDLVLQGKTKTYLFDVVGDSCQTNYIIKIKKGTEKSAPLYV
jgi:hypothetical protein